MLSATPAFRHTAFISAHTCFLDMPLPLLVRKISPEAIFCARPYCSSLRHSLPGIRIVRIFPFSDTSARPRRAASMVSDGETVIVETGSTCSLLARELASKRGVTVITNSVFLCNFVRRCPALDVVLLGGSFQHDAEANVGPLTKLGLAQFSVDKCFIGADAISEDKGVSTINLFRAEVARAMAKSAKKMIVLATSDKVGASAVASSFPLASVHTVITDKDLSREGRSLLDGAGVEVITV